MSKRDEKIGRWRGAAADFLARRMGGTPADWDLAAPPSGSTSCILLARRAGEKRCVARLFSRRCTAHRYAEKLTEMERLGLPAPRLLARSRFWEPWLRGEPWILAEEWLDGPMLCSTPMTAEIAGGLGRSVGRMHAVTDTRFGWGRRRVSVEKFNLHCAKQLDSRLARTKENLRELGRAMEPRTERAVERLRERLLSWHFEGPFVFVHGELGGDDMIWQPARGEVAFLDLAAMRFNHRQFDLEFCRELFEGDGAAFLPHFEAAYWREAGDQFREQAKAEEPLIGGLLDVKRLLTRSEIALNNETRRPSMLSRIDFLKMQISSRPL